MYLKTENATQSSEKSNEFLKKLYSVIIKAGRKGINYRQIIRVMGIKGEEKQKYENYLLSHYTRKLVNYGLVVVKTKSSGNNPNLKVAYCKKYVIPSKRRRNRIIEFLGKRKEESNFEPSDVRNSTPNHTFPDDLKPFLTLLG